MHIPNAKKYCLQTHDGLDIKNTETLEQHGVGHWMHPVKFNLVLMPEINVPGIPMSIPIEESPEENVFEFSPSDQNWAKKTPKLLRRGDSRYLDTLSTRRSSQTFCGKKEETQIEERMRNLVKEIIETSLNQAESQRNLFESLSSLTPDQFQFIKNIIEEFSSTESHPNLDAPNIYGPVYHKRFVRIYWK